MTRLTTKGPTMHTIDVGVRSLAFRSGVRAALERALAAIAWALPRRLVYWCAIRVWRSAGAASPFALSADDALRSWERGR